MPNANRPALSVPRSGAVDAVIRPPGSKSITNRALLCAALAEGKSTLHGALASEDTGVMIDSLRRLGITVHSSDEGETLQVVGCGGVIPSSGATLDVANSGTTIRFLTSAVALGQGEFRLDGVERMRQRPIADLLNALRSLGVDATSEGEGGCPPVVVRAAGLAGGNVIMRGDISSQFLSGLLMAAPLAQGDIEIKIDGPLVSRPYVRMTLRIMESFGCSVEEENLTEFRITGGRTYQGQEFSIEPDASAASYFWAAAAITGGKVTVEGLSRSALQGDVAFCDCLQRMGCRVHATSDSITVEGRSLQGGMFDMNAISDTVQTLAVVALFADGPTTITDVAHIRHKETDRIGDLARELRRLGGEVEERDDGLRIVPANLHGAEIETYNDHRMAMSLALVGLRQDGVVILDPGCVEKTYPQYFADLQSVCQQG